MTTRTIWKFPLVVTDKQVVEMPRGAKILCVQMQGEKPCIWALVDPKTPRSIGRRFSIYGTGHPIQGGPGKFIGTFQMNGGSLVFHLFEEGP
jgi:hypothetical protein